MIDLHKRKLSELLVLPHSLGLKCLAGSLCRERTLKLRQNVLVTFQNKLKLKGKKLGQQTRQMEKGIEEIWCMLDLIGVGGEYCTIMVLLTFDTVETEK